MTEQRNERSEKRPLGGELIIPVAALAFTLYYFYTIIDAPWTAQVGAYFVGTILVVLVVLFLIKSALMLRRGEANLHFDNLVAPVSFLNKRLALLALTLGYIFVVRWLGFTITTFLFLALAMLLLSGGRRKGLIVWLSAALSLGGFLLFIVAFQTRFPEGPFENLIGALF